MANFNNSTVTLAGRKLLAQSIANGQSIEFTGICIGDGVAPVAPENLTDLTHKLFDVSVSRVQNTEEQAGLVSVRGSFKNQGTQGNFYLREIGAYARIKDSEEAQVLFLYTNSGDTADFIPTVGVRSIIEQNIILSVPVGSATVYYLDDPTTAATRHDMVELENRVNEAINEFGEERMAELDTQVKNLVKEINAATAQLSTASGGFVLKGGDTMTGDLTMGSKNDGTSAKIIGDLDGNASKWNGWRLYSDVTELGLTEDNTMREIGEALPDKSRLVHKTGAVTRSADGYPARGTLEIVKHDNERCFYTFTDTDGHRYHSAFHTTEPYWKGWILSDGPPVGSMQMYAGRVAPYGYLLCQGQSVSKTTYAALFAVIGYTYGGEGDSFNVPDFRGMFPRGFDAGRGVDAGRVLGSSQQSGAPNIKGVGPRLSSEIWNGLGTSGAIYSDNTTTDSRGENGDGGWSGSRGWNLDASRVSSVYQNGLNEVRPANIAVNFIIKY